MPVREVERRVDSAEIAEWLAFWQIEPRFSPWHAYADIRAAIHNAFCKKGGEKKPSYFLPKGMVTKRQSTPEMRRAFDVFAVMHNARIGA